MPLIIPDHRLPALQFPVGRWVGFACPQRVQHAKLDLVNRRFSGQVPAHRIQHGLPIIRMDHGEPTGQWSRLTVIAPALLARMRHLHLVGAHVIVPQSQVGCFHRHLEPFFAFAQGSFGVGLFQRLTDRGGDAHCQSGLRVSILVPFQRIQPQRADYLAVNDQWQNQQRNDAMLAQQMMNRRQAGVVLSVGQSQQGAVFQHIAG